MMQGLYRRAIRLARFVPGPVREFIVRRSSPRYTVGAMCRIDREDGRVLLVKPSYRKHWSLPGGVSGRNEDPLEVMHRELFEETGLRCEVVGDPIVLMAPSERIVDFVYYAKVADGVDPDSARPGSAEIAEVGWFPISDVARLAGEHAFKIISRSSTAGVPARLIVVPSERFPAPADQAPRHVSAD